MKKRKLLVLSSIICLILVFAVLPLMAACKASPPEKITIRMATFLNPKHSYEQTFNKWTELVEQYSGYDIEWENHYSGSLLPPKEILTGIKSGTVEMGALHSAINPGELPWKATVSMLPFGWTLETGHKIFRETKPFFDAESAKHNLKTLLTPVGLVNYYFKDPIDPNNPDLRGRKVRAPGAHYARATELLGAAVVSMPPSEMPVAVRTGVVDGACSGLSDYGNLDLYSDLPYLYEVRGFYEVDTAYSMNIDFWNTLPKKLQDAMKKAAPEAEDWQIGKWREIEQEIYGTLKQRGGTVTTLTDAQRAIWRAKMQPIYDEVLQKFPKEGAEFLAVVEKYAK